jgi:hypothetical protein
VSALRHAVALVVALLVGVGAAACLPVAGGAELTVEGLGRVLFRELATDRARALVTFGGGVCLELGGVEVEISAENLLVRNPATAPRVEAAHAAVVTLGWRLVAARLVLEERSARLEDVTLEGHGVVGRALRLEVDLLRGTMRAEELAIITPAVRVAARAAAFETIDVVTFDEVVASTCDCPPESASVRIEGRSARLALEPEVLVVAGGVLVFEGIRLPLPATLELSEATLAELRLPVSLSVEPQGGRGVVVGLTERDGLVADLALGPAADPRWRVVVVGREGPDGVELRLRDGGMALDARGVVALAPDLVATLRQRHEGGRVEGRLQDVALGLAWAPGWRVADVAIGARLDLLAAVSAQERPAGEVASARARGVAGLTATHGGPAQGETSIGVEAGTTAYAAGYAPLAWLSVQPRWRRTTGPVTVDVAHLWRSVAGVSPFDERIDAVTAASRSDVHLTASTSIGRARGSLGLHVRYDWLPDVPRAPRVGPERLRLDAALELPAAVPQAWSWRVEAVVEAAGAVDPRPRRDAFVRASLAAWQEGRGIDAGLALEAGIGPIRGGMRSVVVSAGYPIAFGAARASSVTPFVALDVWPLLAGLGGGPRLVGHGLALEWHTCCGVVDLAYRALPDGRTTTRFAFSVPIRQPALVDLDR